MTQQLDRRRFLILGAGVVGAASLLAACGAGATTTATSGAATASAASTTSAAAAAASAPAAEPTAAVANPAKPRVTLTLMKFAGLGWEQDDRAADLFRKANPDVAVNVQPVVYANMFQKNLTDGAAGTLGDLYAGHNKWMPQLQSKGIALDLTSHVAQNATKMDFSDIFPSVIADAKGIGADGKLFTLPTVVHPAGNAIVLFNVDLMKKAGVPLPKDNNWTVDDLNQIARAAGSPKDGIFGTQVTLSSPLYADQVTRGWGSDAKVGSEDAWLLSKDGTKQQLGSAPVKAAFDWYWQLIKDGFVPISSDATPNTPGGDFFTAGKVVTQGAIVGQYQQDKSIINGKFEMQAFLWPLGPHGYRGSCLSYNTYAIYSKTKNPDEAFALLTQLTSSDTGLWASSQGGSEPYARKSVWSSPDLWKANPITQAAGEWLSSGVDPFPQPANLRFSEWLDAWTQNLSKYLDAKESWDQMYAHTQTACQNILNEPKP
jgi:ABC-type glycerol-3-phosphate transport system substrate-binding protein